MSIDGELRSRATRGLSEIFSAVEAFVLARPGGARNDEVARELALESDVNGGQRNQLTHFVLNRLVEKGALARESRGRHIYYKRA